MASVRASALGDAISGRLRSAIVVTVLLTSSFFVLAMSQNGNEPLSIPPAPTVSILSPYAILEPSTKNNPNDKDGYPPSKSEADPEEGFLLGMVTVEQDIFDVSATVIDYNFDSVDDLIIDNDDPRDLDMMDGVSDGKLAAGSYFLYWNLNKTGYVPVNTTPGSPYNGSNSASLSVVDDQEQFQLELSYRPSETDPVQTVTSNLYTITMWKSASIAQNDLNWMDTQPKVIFADVGETFTIRSKYKQSSAQGLHWMILQSYFNGNYLRMLNVSLYYYNDNDPGSVEDGVPINWDNAWYNKQQYTGTDLGDTDNKDYWVTEYTYEVRGKGFSDLVPYIQTKKGGDTWKIDTGYTYFQSQVPGGVNPAELNISKSFSEDYEGGVVSGPNPPVVGVETVYEIDITVWNEGADDAVNVVVTDTAQLDNVEWLDTYTISQGSLTFDPGTGQITWNVGTLSPNASATLSYQVSLVPTPDMVGLEVLLNAGAYATGNSKTSGDAITAGPTPPLYTEPVIGYPDMTITKTADQDTVNPGDFITYTLHYENAGSSPAYSVVITDTIPDHVTYSDSSPAYDDVDGKTYTWYIGEVAAGSYGDVTITVQVDAGTPDGTVLVNLGEVEYDDYGGEPQPPKQDYHNVTVTAPVMTFDKSVDVTDADPGDIVTYTLTYENIGNGTATDVVIVDTIPEHVTFVSSTPEPTSVSGREYTFVIGDVEAGDDGTVTIVVQVDAYTDDGQTLTNFATFNYDDANGNPYPEQTDSATTTVTAPVVTFEKCVDVSTADPGDLITYTLTVTNSGSGYASGVVIQDTIPEHTTFYDASPMYDGVSGRTYTWEIGDLAPSETKVVTLMVEVDAFTSDGTVLENTAVADYADANDNYYDQLTDSATTTVTAPVMSMSKTANVAYADPGDYITYTIAYVNDGSGYATGVVVKDTIPEHVTYVSSSPAYDGVSGRTYTWNVGDVAPGEGGSITITVEVDAGTSDQHVLTNVATLDYADANDNYYDQLTDSATTTVTAPVMSFCKSADVSQADPGDIITYTLYYKNSGTGVATDVVVKDTIPAHTTFYDASPWFSYVSGSTYTWNVGTVGTGVEGSITLKVKVDVGTADGTVLLNTATLDYDDANGNPYQQLSDDATVTVTAPVMTFTKEADVGYADPGDTVTYTLTYYNGGTGWATGVVVKDTIPDHTTYQSSNPVYDSLVGKTYTWNVGDVGPSSGGTITITVKVDVGTADQTVLTNTATMNYADDNGNYYDQMNDSATTTVTAPVMTFSKCANVATADPGDQIVYTLYYKNSGTGVASGVVVEDTIPEHVTFVSSTPGYTSVSGRTYTWDVGTVNPGATGYIYITVEVDVGTADQTQLLNTATLDYADSNGNYYETLCGSATVTVTAPILSLSKVADVDTADPGDLVTYTLTYKNAGTGLATLVVIVDTLPAKMTFVDATPYPDSVVGNVLTWSIGDVSSGTTASITVEATVNAGTADGAVLHNVATLDYADANGNYYDQLSASYDVTVTAPVMSFCKSADTSTADPGDEIVYTLHYANDGSGSATDVVLVDTLPAHVTFVDATPYPDSVVGDVLTWNIGMVGAYSSGDVTITVTVDAYTGDGELLVNNATLDYDDANGNPYPQLSDEAQVTVTAPILCISKDADVQEADPGDYITYTISYYNSGSGAATGVVVEDTIPEYTTYHSSTPAYDGVSGRTYMWNIGTVAADSGGSITLVVKVDVGTADATLLHNVATLDYADSNGNYYDQLTDDADVTVTAPVVNLTKTADVTAADPGDQITYTIEFTNSGSGNATDIYVNDTIPEHVTFVSSTPSYASVSGRTYTWHWSLLGPGETITITVVVEVDAYTTDQTLLHNVAVMTYDDDNGNPLPQLTAYADVTVTAPVLTFSKVADVGTADPGDYVTYTLEWYNTGTGWASGVLIKDTLSAHVNFVSSTPSYTSVSGKTYTWDLGDVAPGASGSISITVQVVVGTPDQTTVHNVATLDYADANGNYYGQLSDYADVTVTAPVMSVLKVGDVTKADPGDYVTYTITYKNTGTGWASNVVIVDVLPDHVVLSNSTPAPTGQEGNTLTWDVGDVAPGTTATITILVQVEPGTADRTLLHNAVTLDYDDANGNPYAQRSSYWDVRVTAPVMTITKTADVSEADPGDEITYTFFYENTGTGDASDVTIVDILPPEVTFVSASPAPGSVNGQVLTWNIGVVSSMSSGSVVVTVRVKPGTADRTLLHNVVIMDYSDANGNFIERKESDADVVVTAPVMTLEKSAGNVTVAAYITANFTLRIAGEKWHDVRLTFYDNNVSTVFASITRYPGSPDEQAVTLYDVKVDLLGSFIAVIEYTPLDDPINGQWWGADPCWLILEFPDGSSVRLKHTFIVRHESTWIWVIDDFRPFVKGQPVIYEATIPYTIAYENIGTGDASAVVITDSFPVGSVIVDSNPPYDSCVANVCTWFIGDVPSGAMGHIFVTVTYIFDVNNTVVTNEVTLDYSDANGNFIEQLYDSADVTLIMPEISGWSKKDMSTEPKAINPSDTSTVDVPLITETVKDPAVTAKLLSETPSSVEVGEPDPDYVGYDGRIIGPNMVETSAREQTVYVMASENNNDAHADETRIAPSLPQEAQDVDDGNVVAVSELSFSEEIVPTLPSETPQAPLTDELSDNGVVYQLTAETAIEASTSAMEGISKLAVDLRRTVPEVQIRQ